MSDEKKTRTFEMKVIITCSTEETINMMLETQKEIQNGKMQREVLTDGFDKVIATFKEVTNETNNNTNSIRKGFAYFDDKRRIH
jgi:ERCC4-type nuclease